MKEGVGGWRMKEGVGGWRMKEGVGGWRVCQLTWFSVAALLSNLLQRKYE